MPIPWPGTHLFPKLEEESRIDRAQPLGVCVPLDWQRPCGHFFQLLDEPENLEERTWS